MHLSCLHIHIPSKAHTYIQTDRQTDRLIFTIYDNHIPSASQLYSHSFKDRETDRQTHRQTDLSSQYMIIIFPVHLSCIHIPSKIDRQTDRQTDRLIFTIYDNHIPGASQLYSHSFKDAHRQTDRLIFTIYDNHIPSASQLYSHSFKERETQTDRQIDRQTYLHNI